MALQSSTIRPGLIVALSTSVSGNVKYNKRTIEAENITEEGAARAAWETTRTIFDPAEHEAAGKARGRVRTIISAVCATSAFGLLCPQANADKLEAAIAEARAVRDEFNASAKLSRLDVYVITGQVAQDDVEAVRAINSNVRELLQAMEQGLKNLDAKAVRDAADRLKSLGSMLSENAAENVKIAVETARKAARQIVKAGEEGAIAIDQAAINKIASQRTAFLDVEQEAGEVAAPVETGRALDLLPAEVPVAAPKAPAPSFELED